MQKLFSHVSSRATKIWITLYIVAGLALAYVSTVVYPLSVLLSEMPGRVKFMMFAASELGIILRLFIFAYIGYFVYLVLCHVLHADRAATKLAKRGFYLSVCISGVIVNLLQLILIMATAGNISQTMSVVLTVFSAGLLAWLSAQFCRHLLGQAKIGWFIAIVLFILGLVPTILGLLLPQ